MWKSCLNFDGHFVVDPQGRSGGLILLLKDRVNIHIQSFSKGHIDCIPHFNQNIWRFTVFYGNPLVAWRNYSWDLLRRISTIPELMGLPWLVGGDFNAIMFVHEKKRGSSCIHSQMSGFRKVMEDCGLNDLMFVGDKFTWFNKRQDNELIFARLDRFLCTRDWHHLYPTAKVRILDLYGSDYRPIFIKLCPTVCATDRKSSQIFYFENKWILEDDFFPFLQ